MFKSAAEAIVEALIAILRIPVEVAAGLLKFADVMKIDVPNQARPWAAVLVAIFVIALPYILNRYKTMLTRAIGAYGVLCLLFVLVLIGYSTVLSKQLARYEVKGVVEIKTLRFDTKPETFPAIRYGSDRCDVNETHTNRVCSADVRFAKATPVIASANCGSGIVDLQIDPSDPKCITATSRLQGCGYDKLPFGIKNCRGRGWIEFSIAGAGSAPVEQSLSAKTVAGTVSADSPLNIEPSNGPSAPDARVEFKLDVLSDGKVVAVLTNLQPSQKDFSAQIGPDGRLQIRYGKLEAS